MNFSTNNDKNAKNIIFNLDEDENANENFYLNTPPRYNNDNNIMK
jgi:hypothetical protein